MADWTNYWRIVTPNTRKQAYAKPTVNMDDGSNLNTAGYGAFSTTSWYSNLMKGASARMQRYKQYDGMDIGDISRALDIIAEEISNPDKKTGLPFIIDYQTEENQEVSDTTVTTIRAALRHWCTYHDLQRKTFSISRAMVKYGDCFFRKTSDTKKWEYVDPTRVVGIEIDADGEKVAYHIKPSNFASSLPAGQSGKVDSVEISPASAVLHFTLSDDMGDTAPFGLSILQSAYKDYQKLSMLEDSAIIYRIVRAPERRVFYLDVGNMPPQRIKQYIEGVKNDIRQKRIPNANNSNQTDTTYNPESIQEDYFFATTAGGRGSKVETLPGGATWEIPELDYFMNKVFRALRVPTSYLKNQDQGGGTYNDGKVGVAYIEELRFANYIQRLQTCVETVLDAQFKTYMDVTGISVDPALFKLKLPEPQNFALYRQAALDTDLIQSFNAVEGTKYLSKRFMLKRYLGLTEDEINMNEALLKQERKIDDGFSVDELQQMYDPAFEAPTPGLTDADIAQQLNTPPDQGQEAPIDEPPVEPAAEPQDSAPPVA